MTKAYAFLASIAVVAALATAGTAANGRTGFEIVMGKTLSGEKAIQTYIDTGKKSYSAGDYFLTTGPALDKVGGKRIGGVAGVWTIVSQAADNASVIIHLPDGTLYMDGLMRHTAKQNVLQLRGGTGAYKGARGTATWRTLPGDEIAIRIAPSN